MSRISSPPVHVASVSIALTLLFAAPLLASPTTAPYRVAHDAPLNAAEKLLATTDAYTQYRAEFNGIQADRVPAFLYIPKDNRKTHPAVVCQYGSGGTKKTNYIVFLDRLFASRGFVVLTIDVPFKGERKIVGGAKDSPFGPRFAQTLGDYSRAVDYLCSRPDVDPNRIGFVGISWGAITGITYCAHDPRIKAVVSMVGGGNFLGWFNGPIADETREHMKLYDPYYHVALIAPRPLLLINVTRDLLVPRFFAQSLQDAAGPTAKKLWLDTDHIFTGVDYRKLGEQVIDFIEAGLSQTAPPGRSDPSPARSSPPARSPRSPR